MPSAWEKFWMRRCFIVDRTFQADVVLRSLLSSLLLMGVLLLGLFLPLMLEIEATKGGDPLDASAVATVFLYLHDHVVSLVVVYLLFATLTAIRFSHRIAGPMVRFKRDLYAIGDGRFPEPLRTRGSDYMQSEVRALNAMSHSLSQRTQDIVAREASLRSALEALEQVVRVGEDARFDARLEALRRQAEELQGAVAFFADPPPESTEDAADQASRELEPLVGTTG